MTRRILILFLVLLVVQGLDVLVHVDSDQIEPLRRARMSA